MRKSVLVTTVFIFLFLMSFSSAQNLENYGKKKVNDQFTFCQTCANSNYITLSSIETPNGTIFLGTNMTSMGSGDFCYNYTPTTLGRHDFRGVSDGCLLTWSVYVTVTASGADFELEQAVMLLGQFGIVCLLFCMGLIFKKESWKVKEFFFIMALLMGVIFLNSMNIVAGTTEALYKMGQISLVIGITITSIMFMHFLVFATIEVIQKFRTKQDKKWRMDEYN